MQKKAFVLLLVMFLPTAAGQLFEDFEDDTAGQPPNDDVFPWVAPPTGDGVVEQVGFGGSLGLQLSGGSTDQDATGIGGGAFDRYRAVLKADCGPGHNAFDSFLSISTSTLDYRLDVNRESCTINFRDTAIHSNIDTIQDGVFFAYELQLAEDGADVLLRVLIDDTQVFSNTISSNTIGTLNSVLFRIQNAAIGGTTFVLDNLCAGEECLPVLVSEDDLQPSEFDSGLIAFAASAGFKSQESQLFFALILIGLGTVTTSASSKWVAPGRFKNYLLMSVQTLIAVFCVIAAFLDLWMFLVAFMLGLFAVRGGSEVRNTFHQIREALQRQNDRAGDDIGPTEVMEVQVNEERQEAVERAFQRLEDQSGATDTVEAAEGPAGAVSDDRGGDA